MHYYFHQLLHFLSRMHRDSETQRGMARTKRVQTKTFDCAFRVTLLFGIFYACLLLYGLIIIVLPSLTYCSEVYLTILMIVCSALMVCFYVTTLAQGMRLKKRQSNVINTSSTLVVNPLTIIGCIPWFIRCLSVAVYARHETRDEGACFVFLFLNIVGSSLAMVTSFRCFFLNILSSTFDETDYVRN